MLSNAIHPLHVYILTPLTSTHAPYIAATHQARIPAALLDSPSDQTIYDTLQQLADSTLEPLCDIIRAPAGSSALAIYHHDGVAYSMPSSGTFEPDT